MTNRQSSSSSSSSSNKQRSSGSRINVYDKAAIIIQKVLGKKGTIKSLVLSDSFGNKKALYALVCETLKYRSVLDELIKSTSGLEKALKQTKECLGLVLVYETIMGKGIQVKLAPQYKRLLGNFETKLKTAFVKLKIRRKVKDNKELLPQSIQDMEVIPRYVRVNTHKATVQMMMKHFTSRGFKLLNEAVSDMNTFPAKSFYVDTFMPNMLVFHPTADLHDDTAFKAGQLILQDKASCLPAFALSPPKGAHVIDACAAPGNKTSHLSAIMKNTGKIYAFDKDPKRLKTLVTLTTKAGCTNIQATNQDFLAVDPMSFGDVQYILLDPSCSGSGIVSRMDALVASALDEEEEESEKAQERIDQLADFQKRCILHAFKFPNVRQVVYSTCSKHQEENEDVVKHVLSETNEFTLIHALPDWPSRGLSVMDGAEKVIRADSRTDKTIGFFVALFERIQK